jgi:hypothetical protein
MRSSRKFGSGSSSGGMPKGVSPRLGSITCITPDSTSREPGYPPRKGSALSDTPQTPSPHLSETFDPQIRRPSAATDHTQQSMSNTIKPVSERNSLDMERQRIEEEDDEWDLMRVLQQTAPPQSKHDKYALTQGDTVELVEESMASYLNRKTALLMLWFPLGVSVV